MKFTYSIEFEDGSNPYYHLLAEKSEIKKSIYKWLKYQQNNIDIIDIYASEKNGEYRITNSGFNMWCVVLLHNGFIDEIRNYTRLGNALNYVENLISKEG